MKLSELQRDNSKELLKIVENFGNDISIHIQQEPMDNYYTLVNKLVETANMDHVKKIIHRIQVSGTIYPIYMHNNQIAEGADRLVALYLLNCKNIPVAHIKCLT